MTKTISLIILVLIASMTGCVSSNTNINRSQLDPTVIPISEDDYTEDQIQVMAAIVNRLRGQEVQLNATFDPAGKHSVGEKDFKYAGFELTNTILTGYNVVSTGQDTALALLEGAFLFKDVIDRRAGVQFKVQYTITKQGMTILNSSAVTRTQSFPVVEAYILPGELHEVLVDDIENVADLYLYAIQNAIPLNSEKSDAQGFKKGDYTILAFCKDRLAPWSKFSVVMARYKNGRSVIGEEAIYLESHGFRVALIEAQFTPGSLRSKFYINAKYNPTPSLVNKDIVVGEFLNK
ncbi:hypothetical protein GM415_08995 [Pseudodesulfovibrio cashew]|uniref:Uncharacterized protein n=1 Tax=Pseudodesulfovibrio cashew TaxID=2678688 RepID=A0A6I6JGV6_9BACT|nr:hypothetical protein [Pseudodesulfovibrio cashew]QGY40258.1 hypothetical protein GM415_08995 [Pseudodesulfovibrio cashew]